jgi:hypothetical protein
VRRRACGMVWEKGGVEWVGKEGSEQPNRGSRYGLPGELNIKALTTSDQQGNIEFTTHKGKAFTTDGLTESELK